MSYASPPSKTALRDFEKSIEFYTDQERDHSTGLYNYDARLYDPVIGRFLSADSIVPRPFDPQAFNRYSYCYNNPLIYVDPSGHMGDSAALAAAEEGRNIENSDSPGGWTLSNSGYGGSGGGVAFGSSRLINGKPLNFIDISVGIMWEELVTVPEKVWDDIVNAWNWPANHPVQAGLVIIGGELGHTVLNATKSVRHGPINSGPLADDIASTFRSGSYTARTINKPTTFYRVIGDAGNPAGSYWTRIKPKGPLQSVVDLALDQKWGNAATQVVKARIPAGTTIYEGAAAAQRGLVGGGNQVYIPRVDPKWIAP